MPSYEYTCNECQMDYVETRGINEEPKLLECPLCSSKLSRRFAVGSVTFKGEGFYTTDKKPAKKVSK